MGGTQDVLPTPQTIDVKTGWGWYACPRVRELVLGSEAVQLISVQKRGFTSAGTALLGIIPN